MPAHEIDQYIKDQVFRHQKGHGSLQLVPQEINLQPYGEKENCHIFLSNSQASKELEMAWDQSQAMEGWKHPRSQKLGKNGNLKRAFQDQAKDNFC